MRSDIRKYSIDKLKGILSNGKVFYLTKKIEVKNVTYNLDIEIWRSDLKNTGEKSRKQQYFLRIEKYDSKYPGDKGSSDTDQDNTFDTLDELIAFLNTNQIIQKKEWIIE
jgi:hypothetical protein